MAQKTAAFCKSAKYRKFAENVERVRYGPREVCTRLPTLPHFRSLAYNDKQRSANFVLCGQANHKPLRQTKQRKLQAIRAAKKRLFL